MPNSIKTTEVRCRVESAMKEAATQILDQYGLTMSKAIRLFLHQVIAEKGIPVGMKIPNATTRAAMEEARTLTKPRFSNIDELIRDLEHS